MATETIESTETVSEQPSAKSLDAVNKLLVNKQLDIEKSLLDEEIPQKDRDRLKEVRDELLKEDIAKNRRKKLWKEADWLIHRKIRKDFKNAERKKRRLEIHTGVRESKQKRARIVKLSESECKVKVVLDLSLHDLMTDAEKTKTGKQVQRCYAINRRRERPLQLHMTGLRGTEEITKRLFGLENWDVFRSDDDHVDHFGKDKVVYLTGDSEYELEELNDEDAYIIGAMVDHNRHKGLTHKKAVEAGIRHARLPLDRYVDMKSRKVLTIDQCFQILLNRVNGMSWQEAIIEVIPARKGAQLKNVDDSVDQDDDASDDVDESDTQNCIKRTKEKNNLSNSTEDDNGDCALTGSTADDSLDASQQSE